MLAGLVMAFTIAAPRKVTLEDPMLARWPHDSLLHFWAISMVHPQEPQTHVARQAADIL